LAHRASAPESRHGSTDCPGAAPGRGRTSRSKGIPRAACRRPRRWRLAARPDRPRPRGAAARGRANRAGRRRGRENRDRRPDRSSRFPDRSPWPMPDRRLRQRRSAHRPAPRDSHPRAARSETTAQPPHRHLRPCRRAPPGRASTFRARGRARPALPRPNGTGALVLPQSPGAPEVPARSPAQRTSLGCDGLHACYGPSWKSPSTSITSASSAAFASSPSARK